MPSSGSMTQRMPLLPCGAGALLAEEAVVGAVLGEEAGDQLLGGDVHLGDDVDGAGLRRGHAQIGGAAVAQQRTGAAGGLPGEVEQFGQDGVGHRGHRGHSGTALLGVGTVGARGGGLGGTGRAAADGAEVVARPSAPERARAPPARPLLGGGALQDELAHGRGEPRVGADRRGAARPAGRARRPSRWPRCRGRTGPPCGPRRSRWGPSRRRARPRRAAPPGGRRCRAPATGCAGRRCATGRRAARGGRCRSPRGPRRRSAVRRPGAAAT